MNTIMMMRRRTMRRMVMMMMMGRRVMADRWSDLVGKGKATGFGLALASRLVRPRLVIRACVWG